jgi:catechol 2,3-dioxygenase-like lactoylglutathione lyase family enzyme
VGSPESFIHHIGVFASDLATSKGFHSAALAPLGIRIGYESGVAAEYWHPDRDTPSLSVEQAATEPTRGVHVAFAADDRSQVDDFHAAAVAAGGSSRHAPRHWPEYRAYCAFVSDPDGNNIEAVHKEES